MNLPQGFSLNTTSDITVEIIGSKNSPFPNSEGVNVTSGVTSVTFYEENGVFELKVVRSHRFNSKYDSLLLQDLAEPLTIVIPLNGTIPPADKLSCQFWDEINQKWRGEGCVFSQPSPDIAHCHCTHLTDFAVGQAGERMSIMYIW